VKSAESSLHLTLCDNTAHQFSLTNWSTAYDPFTNPVVLQDKPTSSSQESISYCAEYKADELLSLYSQGKKRRRRMNLC